MKSFFGILRLTAMGHSRQPKRFILSMENAKVSPPFEGGVAGTIDYLIYTGLIFRPGWLIFTFRLTQYYGRF